MRDWTLKDQLFGIASGSAPLIAFVCAASFYITFSTLDGGAGGIFSNKQIYIGLCIAYFVIMFFYGIWNLVSLVNQFEFGEAIPGAQRVVFSAFVAIVVMNFVVAALI